VQQENIDGLMFPYGFGDGGGGPTREMVEMQKRCADLEGAPRCRMEKPVKYFERNADPAETFSGELYLAWHRGTLTTQAKTKQGIRRAEIALKQLEYVLARKMLAGKAMPENWREQLDGLWKQLLFNQFHDIAPGTSIARVHERAEKELAEVIQMSRRMQSELLGEPGTEAVIHNPNGWPRTYRGMEIPAQGSAAVNYEKPPRGEAQVRYLEQEGCYELSNAHLICCVSQQGELISVKRPGSDHEYLAGIGNRFLMFKDVNTCYDAWELGSMYEQLPVELDGPVTVAMYQLSGKVELEINRTLNGSALSQYIILDADAKYLTFETEIHWKEKHKLLKVAFPVNALTNEAIHEIQFGHVKRPNHRSYRTDKDRYEVCNHRYTALCDGAHGAAVLNDSKYGVNVVNNEIRLTLLKSPMMPDQNADRGEQCFTYGFYPFDGAFADSDVARQATELNEPLLAGNVYDDLGPILLPDAKNVIVDTIKPADTVHNALLVRVYEAMGKQVDCNFTVNPGIKKIVETDMLEEDPRDVDASCMHFGSFEIKTLLLYF